MITVLGDLHLGRVPYGKPGLASLILRQGSTMLSIAMSGSAQDAVFLAGDVYDRPEVSGPEAKLMRILIANRDRRTPNTLGSVEGNHDSRRKARLGLRGDSLAFRSVSAGPQFWGTWESLHDVEAVTLDWLPQSAAPMGWTEAARFLSEMELPERVLRIMIGHESIDGPGYSGLAGVSQSIELPRSVIPSSIDLVVLGDYHCPLRDLPVYRSEERDSVPFVYTGATFSRFHNGRVTWPRMVGVHELLPTAAMNPASAQAIRDWDQKIGIADLGIGGFNLDVPQKLGCFHGMNRVDGRGGSGRGHPRAYSSARAIRRPGADPDVDGPRMLVSGLSIPPLCAAMRAPEGGAGDPVTLLATICVPDNDTDHLVVDMMGEVLMAGNPGRDHPEPREIAEAIGNFCGEYGADCAVNLRCRSADAARWREAISEVGSIVHVVENQYGETAGEDREISLSPSGAGVGFAGWLQNRLQDTEGLIPPEIDPARFRAICDAALAMRESATPDQLLAAARDLQT